MKMFSLFIDTEQLPFTSTENQARAAELYGEQGFTVIKNFLSSEELATLKTRYSTEERFRQIENEGIDRMSVCYFYKNKTWKKDEDVYQIARRAYRIKNEIALQPNADQFMLEYCYRHRINPENMEELVDAQMNHSFIRVAKYKAGEGHSAHFDYPNELQCIVPLTEKGVDYDEGGLYLAETSNTREVDVDSLVQAGDLIILNAYRKKHYVVPVKCSPGQIGRLHVFMPIIPEYIFARGRGYYFFQDKKFKLQYSLPASKTDKIRYHLQHFMALAKRSARPIDEGYKG